MEEHICQQKMMAIGIFFFIGGIISHFLLQTIFYNFQRYFLFKRFISTTLFDQFPTECHQYYSSSPTSMSTDQFHLSNLLIKISLSVNLKTFYFMLWIRDGDQSVRLVFYLNYFVEKYIIYIFDFGHDKVIQNYMLTFR